MSITVGGSERQPQYRWLKDLAYAAVCELGRVANSRDVASATPAGAHAVRLDGTRDYKTSAGETGCFGRTVHSSPAARSNNFRRPRTCDSPRTGIRSPAVGSTVAQRACASGATARDDGIGPARWRDSVGWPATATTGGHPAGSRRCNSARVDAEAENAARTPSTNTDAVGKTPGLVWKKSWDILEVGPREVLLPKVKPRREALTSHRGAFMRWHFLPAAFRRTLLLYRRHRQNTTGDRTLARLRRDRLAARLARRRRKSGTPIHRDRHKKVERNTYLGQERLFNCPPLP
jgi:hypothetical protein